ncbi:NADH-quinone oxidoreductase subunit M [Alloacidobacterium dinghuense]|uniref:NADH-quinone oxidoreductase subunit M n=2 Tax=Alloacidobacterium dinghuense TaxID=2763107 RepID=A0A7G8BQM0_9BACT|nr:NADH-quinone oxidoreductase subunit M [Alloacidobacterium dinghuense]
MITFVPLAGAIVVALLPRTGKLIQWFTLLVTLATFGLTLHLPAYFQYGQAGFQFEENRPWIASPKIGYHLGIDGISMWLVVLVGFLGPMAVLASWKAIETRTKEFYFLFLIQQTAMLGIFVALDMFLYYGFWELSLVPMAILIAMFGRTRGPQAAIKFFLFTFIPSAMLLVGLLWLYARTGTFDFVETQQYLAQNASLFAPQALWWVSLAFLVAFAVKVPVFPLHGWLSDVFSEAPTAMAMVVAGKLGLYSIIRFNLGLFPAQSREIAPLMIALAVIGILYGALIALVQPDLKRFLAFSTIGHLSFCTLGIFCFTVMGLNGTVFHILNHELSGAAMLILFGILYERYGTYDMTQYGGMSANLPNMATLYVITMLSLIGLPILNGFVGEFLILSSSFGVHPYWGAAATIGVILSAWYMLSMIQKLFYGPQSRLVANKAVPDVVAREGLALVPAAILMLVLGVASPYWIRAINGAVDGLVQNVAHATSTLTTNVAEKR